MRRRWAICSRFEDELARAVAGAGLIPKKHAATIAACCDASLYDPAELVRWRAAP